MLKLLVGMGFACAWVPLTVFAQGTTFTYQGRLTEDGSAANGTNYGMAFYLYDAPTNGNLLGNLGIVSVAVSNGVFTVPLNFGSVFDGGPRWLEIAVQKNGGAFTNLSPRQPLTPAPYAMFANTASNLSGTVSGSQVSGAIPLSGLPAGVLTNGASGVNITGTFYGDGSGVTNLSFMNVNSGGLITIVTNRANFIAAASPGVGLTPLSVATADVNNDGKMDLISANFSDFSLTVLTNAGGGRFVLSSSPVSGNGPYAVTADDVNGDSKPDLISVNLTVGSLSVLTNNGSGGFGNPSQVIIGGSPRSVITADVNGDGKKDIITANTSSNALTILTNNGSGGFVVASTPAVGLSPYSVTKADVNNDGKMDLISANGNANSLTILTNNGSGGFVLSSSPTVGTFPISVTAADINGDGKTDLISANVFSDSLTVLTNNGSSGFAVAASPSVGSQPYCVIAADLNGDGKMDLVSANNNGASLTVLLNDGQGGFIVGASPVTGANPYSVVSLDANNDGRPDLACANSGNNNLTVLTNSTSSTVVFANTLSGDGGGLTGLNANAIVGGVSTNLTVTVPSGTKNLLFMNGILRAVY